MKKIRKDIGRLSVGGKTRKLGFSKKEYRKACEGNYD